jgi:copper chaperone NosL
MLLAAALLAGLASCERGNPLAPPVVHWGQDVCGECGMIVSDDRYAAAAILRADGGHVAELYDDIGCLLVRDAAVGDRMAARYVRDAGGGGGWLVASEAAYLRSSELQTPMASGVAGFADAATATARLDRWPGQVLDLAALRRAHAEGALAAAPWSEDADEPDPGAPADNGS